LADYVEKALSLGEGWEGSMGRMVAQIWNLYEKQKMKENSLDFDDLLLKAVKLLKDNAEIRKIYQEKWEYIHIDEYQDTNEAQYLMSKLLSEKTKNICVVGDADQNIYSWRGANLKNILSFEKDYPNAKIILLEQNYRSTKNILEAANEIIKKNKYRPDKNLFTNNIVGEKIELYEALDESDEADFVATKILEIMDTPSPRVKSGHSPFAGGENSPLPAKGGAGEGCLSEIAVLYRANFQSRALEEAMLRYNIPYQVLGVKFFERKEIKDTLAYLRAALNPDSLSDIKRIINFPARGIGKVTLAKIFAGQKETLPIKVRIKVDNFYKTLEEIKEKVSARGGQGPFLKTSEVVKFVVKKSGIEQELSSGTEEDMERLENIKELATLALKYDNLQNGAGVEKLLEDASLASDQDSLIINEVNPVRGREGSQRPSASNGVKLMTVHASKGLEFKYVFVTGLEDGLFPHERNDEPTSAQGYDEAREEERRLFYVAITRAKEKLFLSFANFRTIFGSRNINAPSEFIADIPADLLEKEGEKGLLKTIYL
jgi:DNA helicase-2/ATP-dependent DNA helicase PcrA